MALRGAGIDERRRVLLEDGDIERAVIGAGS